MPLLPPPPPSLQQFLLFPPRPLIPPPPPSFCLHLSMCLSCSSALPSCTWRLAFPSYPLGFGNSFCRMNRLPASSLIPSLCMLSSVQSRCCQNILLYFDDSSQWPAVYKRPEKVRYQQIQRHFFQRAVPEEKSSSTDYLACHCWNEKSPTSPVYFIFNILT